MQQENKPFFNRYAFNGKLADFLNNSNYLNPFKNGIALAIIAYCIGLIAVEISSVLSVADKIGIASHDVINRALSAIDDDLGKIIMFITDDVITRKPYGPKLP